MVELITRGKLPLSDGVQQLLVVGAVNSIRAHIQGRECLPGTVFVSGLSVYPDPDAGVLRVACRFQVGDEGDFIGLPSLDIRHLPGVHQKGGQSQA